MTRAKKNLTPRGVKRRFRKGLKGIEEILAEFRGLEAMIPPLDEAEYKEMLAERPPLSYEHHVLAMLGVVIESLEEMLLFVSDNIEGWWPGWSEELLEGLGRAIYQRAAEQKDAETPPASAQEELSRETRGS